MATKEASSKLFKKSKPSTKRSGKKISTKDFYAVTGGAQARTGGSGRVNSDQKRGRTGRGR